MNWLLKPQSKTRGEIILILDLGSTSIGATLGTINIAAAPGTCLEPLATARLPLSASAQATPEQFKYELSETLEQAMQTVLGDIKPAQIFCFLSSLYYVGAPRVIKLAEDKPFTFSSKLIKKLVDEEVESVKAELGERGWAPWSMEVLEREVLALSANGYELKAPNGESVNQAKINVFIAGADQGLLETVRQVIRRRFAALPLYFRSFMGASFVVMRDLLPETPSFVMVDISGSLTDIAIVNQGSLVGVGSFPLGYQSIVKKLAEEGRSNQVDIETKLALLAKNNLAPSLEPLVRSAERILTQWRRELEFTCQSVLGNLFLPDTIILIGENELVSLFTQGLKRAPLTALTLGSHPPVVYEVSDKLISQLCQGVPVPGDSFLLLEALFCHKIKSLIKI